MISGINSAALERGPQQRYVHVIDSLRVGGAQTHLVTILREAVKIPDIEHHVVSLFGDGEMSPAIRDLGIPVHTLNVDSDLSRWQLLAAVRKLESLFRELRPHLVEAHLTFSRILACYAAWRVSVPKRIGFEQGDLYLNSWKFRIANFIGQLFAHRIVVCSEALRHWVRKTHGVFDSKLVVLHNCVDVSCFRPEGPTATDVGFSENDTVFAAVGTLGRGVNKRVDVCIRAIAAARNAGARVSLVVCGDGEQRRELEDLTRELGVEHHVRFLGTRCDVDAVLRACDGLCHAAPWEPFGIVAIEAMSVGLPVILPDSGGVREILRGGDGGFLYPPLDHQALANAMTTLAADSTLRQSMGAAARRVVERDFSVRQYVRKLYGIYGFEPSPLAKAPPAAPMGKATVTTPFHVDEPLLP